MKKKLLIAILVMVAILALMAIPALATDSVVYVSGTGVNTNSGLTPESPVKDLSTAVGKLPNGGTIVLVGDVSTSGTYTLPAPTNGGKITITAEHYGKNYGAALKLGTNSKGIFVGSSEVEFKNLTIRQGYSGACSEFYTGPSMKFGEGVTFLNSNGSIMVPSTNGDIAIRVGSYTNNATIASARLEMVTGTISYIQGGNNKSHVTDSTIILHEGVKLTNFMQCGGTNRNVGTSHVTINGAQMPALYLNGYGSANMNTKVELTANYANIDAIYDGRPGDAAVTGKIKGDVEVTLNGCKVSTIDMDYGIATTEGKTASLTIQDSSLHLSENSTFHDWDSLTLQNSDVYVSGTYAGPASVNVDASSALVLSKDTNTADAVPENGQLERDYTLTLNGDGTHTLTYTDSEGTHDIVRTTGELGVVYLDGTAATCGGGATIGNPVNSFAAAYARLKNTGGTIVVTGNVTLSETYPAFPAKSGKVTVTGKYNGQNYSTSLLFNCSANQIVQFKSETEFNNLTFNRTGAGYVEIATGPKLTFGEGMTMLTAGNALPTGNVFMVRAGNATWSGNSAGKCASAEFTMLSGTISYVQGGNKWTHTGVVTINIGGTAVIKDHVQGSGVNGFSVDTVTLNIDGGTIPTLYLSGHAASSVNNAVTVNIKNLNGTVVDYQRSNSTGYAKGSLTLNVENSTLASLAISSEPVGGDLAVTLKDTTVSGGFTINGAGKGVTGNVSVTLDNANVTSLDGIGDTGVTGTVSLTLKNCPSYTSSNTFSAFDSLTLENSVVQMGVKYEGPASVNVDADSTLYISGAMNTEAEVPAKVGEGKIIWLNADSFETGDPITMKYDDRLSVGDNGVAILDGGTPTSYQVGYGVADGTLDRSVVKYDGVAKKLIATGIGTAKVVIGDKLHEVTVEPAPISLFLMIGQSNMAGADGNKNQSVITEAGQVYSTFGVQGASWANSYGLNGLQTLSTTTAPNFVASALAGDGSHINRNGTTTNLSVYPLDALSEGGIGKPGIDSGFAYEWTKNTKEKVWLVNAAEGGTSITTWVPSGSNYKQAVALFQAAQATLADEIAAGHYTLSYMGYLWCQGCADRVQTADWYVENFTTMHEQLKQDLSYDFGGTTGRRTLESANMILVRACGTDGANSQNDTKVKEYHTYKDLEMTGVRVAQYYMANSNASAYQDIHMVSNLGDSFVYWDDAKTQCNVKQIFEARYPNGLDYTTHVGVLTMPEDELDVHHTIHYSQLGYNEVGREAARNLFYRLNPTAQPDVTETVKLLAWDGYTDLAGRTDTAILTEAQTVVPVTYPLYRSKELTVTGLDHGIYELTGTRAGTVTAALGEASVTYTLNPESSLKTFRWEMADGTFATVTGEGLTENALQLLTGSINADGTLNKAGFRLSESVVLLHDQPWSIEWKGTVSGGKGSNTAFMLLASSASSNTLDAPHIIVSNHSVIISRRLDDGNNGDTANNSFDHYRCSTAVDLLHSHEYALVNRVTAEGNMVYLYIDGVEIGALDDNYKGDAAMVESNWVSGKDFVLSHIGAKSANLTTNTDTSHSSFDHTLVGALEYLQVRENRLTKVDAVAADCEDPGNILYYVDNVTGELYADEQGIALIPDANGDGDITLEDTVIAALGHSHTNYVSNNDATCTENGTETAICDRDGCNVPNTREDAGSKREHKFTTYVSNNDATCEADGTKTAECDYGCGETDTVKETAHGHKLTKVDAKAATCTEEGAAEHYNCSACKKNFSDAEGKTEMSSVVIAAGHAISKVDAKAPTETENGHKEHYACAACGKLYADAEGKTEVTERSVIISATGAPTDTGDTFSILWIAVMVISMAGITVLVAKRKEF